MNPRETIGIVGLGNMGYPIAQNLIKAGYAIAGREIDQARWQPTDHLLYVNSLEALIERTSVLLLSLPDGHTVQSIIEQLLNGCANRSITVVDTSTIGAKASQAVEKLVRSSKLRYLDSPVSGGVRGAVAGTLAVMCAGPKNLYNEVLPILECFSANQFLIGPQPGQAQTLKVLNNFLSATALAASCEALHFGQTQGLDLQKMCDVINVSTGMNTATLDKIPHQVVTNRFNAGFSNSLLLKDISLYLEGCDEAGITGDISRTVVQLWDNFVTSSPNDDATGLFRYTGKKSRRISDT
ncbi:MAG: NAD(P)-dependent oxidoreductase [Arenicellales bacterium]|jgi:3-hydroxyisobutyrate dehydrogenase|nr:NAD(P)-dependent oxidoreductase [Arenicellales bacterium]